MGFIGLLLILILLYILWQRGDINLFGKGNKKTPLEILQERFARGEISEEEYRRRKELLAK